MSLPLYSAPVAPTPKPPVMQLIPCRKQILGHFTHKKVEDRISQRVWYENITYPEEVRLAEKRHAFKGLWR
jgi:hypothetical protein